jgi:hypothetical protein
VMDFEFDTMVGGNGNGFYPCLVIQLNKVKPQILCEIEENGNATHEILLREKGLSEHLGNDISLTLEDEVYALSEFTDCVVAIIDTRNAHLGFCGYFVSDEGDKKRSYEPKAIPNKGILRLAFTGAEFFSVCHHLDLNNGAIRDGFDGGRGR